MPFCGEAPVSCSDWSKSEEGDNSCSRPSSPSSPSSSSTASRSLELGDKDPDEQKLFGTATGRRSQRSEHLSITRKDPCDSPTGRGSDRQLQAFISLRDQVDKDTEVRKGL